MTFSILKIIILFLKNSLGVLNKPYETYRRLSSGQNSSQVLLLWFLIGFYLSFSTLLHQGLRVHPLILSLSFSKVFAGTLISYILILTALVLLGRFFGGEGNFKTIFLPWSYSLLPTLLWFWATGFFYFLLPPPRTASFLGQAFSFLFIAFSFGLFFWKGVLYYLTLRFGMKLDFLRIAGVSIILFPAGFFYAILMYRLGIFRVPFI